MAESASSSVDGPAAGEGDGAAGLGEIPGAGEETGEEALLVFCRSRLASYKAPTRLRFVELLPRNAAGKLLRHALREEWSTEGPGR